MRLVFILKNVMSRKDKSLDQIKFIREGTLQEISPGFFQETKMLRNSQEEYL